MTLTLTNRDRNDLVLALLRARRHTPNLDAAEHRRFVALSDRLLDESRRPLDVLDDAAGDAALSQARI